MHHIIIVYTNTNALFYVNCAISFLPFGMDGPGDFSSRAFKGNPWKRTKDGEEGMDEMRRGY